VELERGRVKSDVRLDGLMLNTTLRYGLISALLVASCISVVAQKAIDGVIVTGEVKDAVLCTRPDEAGVYKMLMSIKLHTKNIGPTPVIVSSADANTNYYKFAKTLDDLQVKDYAHIGWVNSGPVDPTSVPSAPAKPFRVVPPNGSIDINVDFVGIVVEQFEPGTTYVQMIAENWPDYSEDYVKRISGAWKSHGTLWAHSLHPDPIAFVMPAPVKRASCP
jgi:hypothetical protein